MCAHTQSLVVMANASGSESAGNDIDRKQNESPLPSREGVRGRGFSTPEPA